jgi:hypothetical protein
MWEISPIGIQAGIHFGTGFPYRPSPGDIDSGDARDLMGECVEMPLEATGPVLRWIDWQARRIPEGTGSNRGHARQAGPFAAPVSATVHPGRTRVGALSRDGPTPVGAPQITRPLPTTVGLGWPGLAQFTCCGVVRGRGATASPSSMRAISRTPHATPQNVSPQLLRVVRSRRRESNIPTSC